MQENFNKVFLPEKLRMIEKRMTSSGGQFLAANALSWADIHFLQVYYTLPTGIFILYTSYRYIHITRFLQVYSYYTLPTGILILYTFYKYIHIIHFLQWDIHIIHFIQVYSCYILSTGILCTSYKFIHILHFLFISVYFILYFIWVYGY